MTDQNGLVSDAWNKWFQQIYLRMGGALGAPIPNANLIPLTNLISAPATLTISTLYTGPTGQKTVINSFHVQNTDNVAHTISVWFVVQGALPSTKNLVVNNVSIPALTTLTMTSLQFQVLNALGTIQAQASAAGVLNIIANGRLSS
jgi:hypothetical protein